MFLIVEPEALSAQKIGIELIDCSIDCPGHGFKDIKKLKALQDRLEM
jgi:hypothetical protein